MTLVTFCHPTHIYRSDSCPFGLRGYSDKGVTWQFEVPEDLRFRASNNLLEYVALIISPWVDLLAGRLHQGECALSMTDSTTSAGWLRKTNFRELTGSQQNKIIGAFALALHERRFSGPSHDTLAVGTIQNSISAVCATFRENGRPNPTKDNHLQLSFILHQ
jgi:hypothetical protein